MEWVFVVILVVLFAVKIVISRQRLQQAKQRSHGPGDAPDHLPGRGGGATG